MNDLMTGLIDMVKSYKTPNSGTLDRWVRLYAVYYCVCTRCADLSVLRLPFVATVLINVKIFGKSLIVAELYFLRYVTDDIR